MEKNQDKNPPQKTTKEMSSDVEKVKNQHQSAPPKGPAEQQQKDSNRSREDEEAEKGHS
ncbi:hypothetical protein [Pontibacter roseus]|uniref:hypothetical protein n=1 Tax=Pontibacter roseus TaxID=336989 RepID=UPI00035DE9B3|nr:hypothetical protein [Pontibacter roseus]